MIKEPKISLFDLVMCLSDAVDLVSPALVNHHKQVAYIAFSIGTELGLPLEQRNELALGGGLHDIGILSLKDRMNAMQFEHEVKTERRHEHLSYLLLKMFEPLSGAAAIVRFHHVPWDKGGGTEFDGESVPLGSHILQLADRVAALINRQQEILGQVEAICWKIEQQSGKMFMPKLVDAFKSIARKEYFWFDAISLSLGSILSNMVGTVKVELGLDKLLSLANMFCRVIDFRSAFTATHSSGIAASAKELARLAGFAERECQMMKVAGYLHDLGKLAVPLEILEKPAKLTKDEINIMQSHTFHTYRILESIKDFDVINAWAAYHHERLNGTGYPFHLKGDDISLGSRIMAVADVFTAVTEDRPYRKGMNSNEALKILQRMADNSALDPHIVSLLRSSFDEINSVRMAAQTAAIEEYKQFMQSSE